MCIRQFDEQHRHAHEWKAIWDQEVQRWICPRCINILGRQSRTDIDGRGAEEWQTVEFKIELQAVLAEHRKMIALEEDRAKAAASDDTMDVEIIALEEDRTKAASMDDTMDVDM